MTSAIAEWWSRASDRRQINADDKLEKIFGQKSASMFEMNEHLSAHVSAPED